MTQEHLLNPRYKVLIKYPGAIYKVGTIIYYNYPYGVNEKYYDQFPSVFEKLLWYEERKIEEMPPFVEIKGKVYKVDKWRYVHLSLFPVCNEENDLRAAWFFYRSISKPVFK